MAEDENEEHESQVEPEELRRLGSEAAAGVRRYARTIAGVVGDDLLGIYLYGSLARGCFHPATSDLDVLVVVRRQIPDGGVAALLDMHATMDDLPLDALFVTEGQLGEDAVLGGTEFAVRKDRAGRHFAARSPKGKLDLPLIRQDTYDCGITLLGAPVREVIRPVPWPALAASLRALFPHLAPQFKNPVLMLCRVCCAFATHSLCSKQQAGEWALTSLPAEWHPLIDEALAKCRAGIPDNAGETAELRAFADFCSGYVSERDV